MRSRRFSTFNIASKSFRTVNKLENVFSLLPNDFLVCRQIRLVQQNHEAMGWARQALIRSSESLNVSGCKVF